MPPKEMKSKNTINITHGDVDGIVCAAQIVRLEQSYVYLIFSNSKYIHSALYRVCSNNTSKRVYITDIPANLKTEKPLKRLFDKNTEIFWIDHHPWLNGVYERIVSLSTEVVYNEALNTPAGILLGRWLKKEDPY